MWCCNLNSFYPNKNSLSIAHKAPVWKNTVLLQYANTVLVATEWIPALPGLTERTSALIKDLVTGDKLYFRIKAVNVAGESGAATIKEPVTVQEILREYLY